MTLEELLRQGKSFGQGASNAAASTVTGPVDMLAWLLRKGGVDVGDTPIGGEAWMRQKGLMATPENRLAGLLGEGAGLAAPIVAAAKAPEIAGGLLQMGRNLATPQTMNKQTGAIVYHGSPHKFDKFDASKIGTGEGAQAYGHGLYFAENPKVAQEYQRTLSKYAPQIDGKSVFESYADGTLASQLANKAGLSRSNATEAAHWFGEAARTNRPISEIVEERAARSMELLGDAGEVARIRALGAKVGGISQGGTAGSLYKVDLPDEHIAKMLDWDKPLSQQHPDVQKALAGTKNKQLKTMVDYANVPYGAEAGGDVKTMGEAFRLLNLNLHGKSSADSAKASALLAKQGIPGIRYLDGGSRGAGAGSSNFVVFPGNEGLLKILERNGGKP